MVLSVDHTSGRWGEKKDGGQRSQEAPGKAGAFGATLVAGKCPCM